MNKNKDWENSGLSFNQVADEYDTYRPDYPEELIATILKKSEIPDGGKILEIGSGTGKATLPFARRGYEILCIDPGEKLVEIARKNLQNWPAVRWEIAAFQDWQEIRDEFDLVISATAFHWVPKPIGYLRTANALKVGCWMALFWNMQILEEGHLFEDLRQVYRERAPKLDDGKTSEDVIREREQEIRECGCFDELETYRFDWTRHFNTRQYLGLLNTFSDRARMSESQHTWLLEGVAAVVERHGGLVNKPYQAVLNLARVRK